MSPDPSGALKKAKRRVRAEVLAARDTLAPEERARRGAGIVERVLGLPEVRAAATVMAFWSFGSEVPTSPLIAALHRRGVRLALPSVRDGVLVALAYEPGDPTVATGFGSREPEPGAEEVSGDDLDVVVTPGLAFDRTCGRVGYGGGFYDGFFRERAPSAFRAAVAFSLQVTHDAVPAGRGDLRVHAVVTEDGTIRCGASPST